MVRKIGSKPVASAKKAARVKPAKATAKKAVPGTKATAVRGASSKASRSVIAGWDPSYRVRRINEIAGSSRRAADLLGVDVAQTSRWASGESVPSPERARVLLDVEHALTYALTVWESPATANDWLTTPNWRLDGATPLQWIQLHGSPEVIAALRAEAAGAYA